MRHSAMSSADDKSNEENLYDLVEELTTTGEKTLNEKTLKQLKKLCKNSDDNLQHVYHLLMTQLEKEHAEIRFSAFQIIDELFLRSHLFRSLLTEDFSKLLELTVETKKSSKLPPPLKVARNLKILALARIEAWYNQFGKGYKRLELGYEYLKRVKKVDFAGIRSQTELQRRRQEETQSRQQQLEKKALIKVGAEMKNRILDIKSAITQANSCLNLIFPRLDEDITEENFLHDCSTESTIKENTNESNEIMVNEELGPSHGIISRGYNINIRLPLNRMQVIETDDNTDVIKSFKDTTNEIKLKFLPMVSKWIKVLSKSPNTKDQLERAVKLKNDMKDIVEKYQEIEIEYMKSKEAQEAANDSDDDADELFVDVPEKVNEGLIYEDESLSKNIPSQATTEKLQLPEDISDTPGCSKDSEKALRRRKLFAKAPVVPFDNDLQYWGQDKLHVTPVIKNDSLHRFWHHAEFDEEFMPAGLEESLRSRALEFSGKFENVKWSCRAPMKNGKLCTRQDRFKCPFHGKIIARDVQGQPSDPADAEYEKERKRKIEEEESREIQLDIEIATGKDLGASTTETQKKKMKKSSGKITKRYSRLTNLEKITNTARKRLEDKVLHPSAIAKVNETLNYIDKRRNLEKFGSNFNYLFKK